MEENTNKSWVEEMIEREALPKTLRTETVEDFCARHGVSVSTYYYQSSKTENWKKVLEISLMSAKKEVPEVLKVLADKAKGGDAKFVDMYLNYVIQLAKQLDIKSDGKEINAINYIVPNGTDNKTNEETTRSISSSEQ
jgi:hypothetical protein